MTSELTLDMKLPTEAHEFLSRASELLMERGQTYDKSGNERSMGRAIQAFNAITGHNLDEADGWLLMVLLKYVRQYSTQGFHRDSAEDAISYSALLAEALANS